MKTWLFVNIIFALLLVPSLGELSGSHALIAVSAPEGVEPDASAEATLASNLPDFVPTDEWQEILPGQAIPPGLHVRMSMTTGIKMAKLLDPSESDDDAPVNEAYSPETSTKNVNQSRTDGETSEKLEDKDEDTIKALPAPHKASRPVSASAQAYAEERRTQGLEKMSKLLFEPTDTTQVMVDAIALLDDPASEPETVVHALETLEDHVHQVDAGVDFLTLGGLAPLLRLVHPSLQTVDGTRTKEHALLGTKALLVIGAAAQNNAVFLNEAFARALPTALLEAWRTVGIGGESLVDAMLATPPAAVEADEALDAHTGEAREEAERIAEKFVVRLLFAMGCLIRGHANSTNMFVEGQGLQLIEGLLSKQGLSAKLRAKGLTLAVDLLEDVTINKLETTVLENMKKNWCGIFLESLSLSDANTRSVMNIKEQALKGLTALVSGGHCFRLVEQSTNATENHLQVLEAFALDMETRAQLEGPDSEEADFGRDARSLLDRLLVSNES